MTPAHLAADLAAAALAVGLVPAVGEAPGDVVPLFRFQDPAISESSGLVDRGDTVLTVNDSGDGPVVYVVDARSGRTVGRTTFDADVVDVEALAQGRDGSVWVGDIGDNGARRTSISVYRLPAVTAGDRTARARRFDLQYPGGPRDAEALLVHPRTGRLHVVSKGLFSGQVFAAPRRLRTDAPNTLVPVGRAPGLVTDGAFTADGEHALLRTYSLLSLHDTGRWESRARMPLPDQPQGEGLAVSPTGDTVLVSTEGRGTRVLSVPLSRRLRAVLAPAPDPSGEPPSAEPVPAAGAQEGDGEAGDVERGVTLFVLVTVTLAAALGVRALFRGRARR